jgi:hypothetical protein
MAVEAREVAGATGGGDGRKLRGIPAIGRGVAGAINGSNPTSMLHRISLDRSGSTRPYSRSGAAVSTR